MRFITPLLGRSTALLASILVVGSAAAGSASAADFTPEDTALAMVFPNVHFSLPAPGAAPETATADARFRVPMVAGIGQAIDAAALDQLRGGDDVDNTVILDGSVTDNTADRIVSGSNLIQDGAFANANGINTVIQNSGSNVLIQNGMVVTVQFTAPGP